MARTLAPRRPLVAAALFGTLAACGLAAAPARAQSTTTVNFNSLNATDGTGALLVNNCYTESGFSFTGTGVACGTPGTFVAYGPDAAFINSALTNPALSLNNGATSIDISRAGGAFGFSSLQLGTFDMANANVSFLGTLIGGSTASATCPTVSAMAASLVTCNLSAFAGMSFTSVRMTSTNTFNEPYVLMDNLVFTPSAAGTTVPEPATVALVGLGLAAVGAAARRRRA